MKNKTNKIKIIKIETEKVVIIANKVIRKIITIKTKIMVKTLKIIVEIILIWITRIKKNSKGFLNLEGKKKTKKTKIFWTVIKIVIMSILVKIFLSNLIMSELSLIRYLKIHWTYLIIIYHNNNNNRKIKIKNNKSKMKMILYWEIKQNLKFRKKLALLMK